MAKMMERLTHNGTAESTRRDELKSGFKPAGTSHPGINSLMKL